MLSAIILDMRWFALVLFVVYLGVTNAFYFEDKVVDGKELSYMEFVRAMYGMILFADFGHAPDSFNGVQWAIFMFSTLFVFIIMMNLLIAIVGDTYARVN